MAGIPVAPARADRLPFQRLRRPARPDGLKLALMISVVAAVSGVLVTVLTALEVLPVEAGDEVLDGPAARLAALLPLLFVAIPGACAAYGLLRERGWTRPLLLGWCASPVALVAVVAPMLPRGEVLAVWILAPCLTGLLWLYLYERRAVVDYYDWLAQRE
jgi:hypothetical protein